jgi:hypothetical protein
MLREIDIALADGVSTVLGAADACHPRGTPFLDALPFRARTPSTRLTPQ